MRIAATARIVALSSIALGCGADRVVDPSSVVDVTKAREGVVFAREATVPGSYVLSLLLVGPELVLRAHIPELASGVAADGGTATFQVCLRKGGSTLQRVPLPSAQCEKGGPGNWIRQIRVPVNASGDAAMSFGIAPRVATVGFRFEYSGVRGGVASGVSLPVDFVP